jgi:hypothetical protein
MLRQFFADKIVKHGGVQEFPQQTYLNNAAALTISRSSELLIKHESSKKKLALILSELCS